MSSNLSGNLLNAVIDANSSGDNEIIAAPSSGYIAIDHINFVNEAAVGITFKSGSNALSGAYSLAERQPITLENTTVQDKGVITCNTGEAFNINLDSAVQISGFVRYRIVGH